jgi:nicotinamidase-related amidase
MENLIENSADFLKYLDNWMGGLKQKGIRDFPASATQTAILAVDVIEGFCDFGPLASPRVGKIAKPVSALISNAWAYGIQQIFLINDTHEHDAIEFQNFPPHCTRGSQEAQPVKEIRELPFFDQMKILPKNSISSNLNTILPAVLNQSPKTSTYIVVGDCTDLCTYQLAMFLRLDANARQIKDRKVIVPTNCVDTYDLSVEGGKQIGVIPHPADFLHAVFLYHMMLNGVEVVSELTF